jgi:hypothetical protein
MALGLLGTINNDSAVALEIPKTCIKDEVLFCKNVPAQQYENCLWQNYGKLSPYCKQTFKPFYDKWPCNVDAAQFCKGIPDQKYREGCLFEHYYRLAPECRRLYSTAVKKNPCLVDTGKFCRELTDEGAKDCIWEHYAELTPECKKGYTVRYKEWPCSVDKAKYCKKTGNDKKAIDICFSNHMDQLSLDCKTKLNSLH